ATSVRASDASWPMFRGNPALTDIATGTLPDKLSQLWSFKTGGPVRSSAAIVDGRVFIGSGDGSVYALDLGTGKKIWVARTGGPVDCSPLVLEGGVFFGSTDASLYAVDAANGKQRWKHEPWDKRAYFGHYENEFLCIDLDKGERAWTFKDRDFPYFSSPAVTQDRVVFGGRDRRLHCVKRDTGENVWAFSAQGKVDSSPVVVGDKVAVG